MNYWPVALILAAPFVGRVIGRALAALPRQFDEAQDDLFEEW